MESREQGAEGIIKLGSEMAADEEKEMKGKEQGVNGVDNIESETDDEYVASDLKCPSDLSEIINTDKNRVNEERIGEQIKCDQQAAEHCDQDEDQHDVSLGFGGRSLVQVDVGEEELRTEGQVVDHVENEEVEELAREDGAICGFETDALEQFVEGSSGPGEHQNRILYYGTLRHVLRRMGMYCT